jgi:cyclophilin family peptidyl-prolyl cis-trans isomerase
MIQTAFALKAKTIPKTVQNVTGLAVEGWWDRLRSVRFYSFLRMVAMVPLWHIKNGNLPRRVRKVE